MAIHDDLEGVEVVVCTDGQDMVEYDAEDEESNHVSAAVRLYEEQWTVTKYIESVTNNIFSIKCKVHPHHRATSPQLGFDIYLDGVRVFEPLVTRDRFSLRTWTYELKGAYSGQYGGFGTLNRFKFSAIETESDGMNAQDIKSQKTKMSQVGDITVKVYRYNEGTPLAGTLQTPKDLKSQSTKVHEKALKGEAKSHGITLGPQEEVKVGPMFSCEKLDGNDYPLAIFKFKYRSKEALKQLLIIARTPSPEPDLLNGLGPQERREMEELAERLRRKRRNGSEDVETFIKSEYGNAQRGTGDVKRRRTGEKITIDLTEDSEDEENRFPIVLD